MKLRNLLCNLFVLSAASCVAQADTIYTTPSAWNAAVTGITNINFEGIAGANSYINYPTLSTVVGGVTFSAGPSSSAPLLFVIGDNFYGYGVAVISSQQQALNLPSNNDLLITLPHAVTAIAFNFWVDPGTVTVTLSDGTSTALTASGTPTEGFYGVVAPGGITSLDITQPFSPATENVAISSFSYATAATSTPEPSTAGLTILALLTGLALFGKRSSLTKRRT